MTDTNQDRIWQVWIAGQHVATVELEMWHEAARFHEHLTTVSGQKVELTLDAWAKGELITDNA